MNFYACIYILIIVKWPYSRKKKTVKYIKNCKCYVLYVQAKYRYSNIM